MVKQSNTKMIIFRTNSPYSWRKILTALCALLFALAFVGQQWFHTPEVPGTYMAVISLVFAFYFVKEVMEKAKPLTPGE
jgi:hypothetical protein